MSANGYNIAAWRNRPGLSLYDATCRMFLGRWEKIPIVDGQLDLSGSGFQSIRDLIDQVKQLGFDDRLPVWGKAQGQLAMWEMPKPVFWKNHQIDYLSFTDGDQTGFALAHPMAPDRPWRYVTC
jgi:hypothetical protein